MTKDELKHFLEWTFPKLIISPGTIIFYQKNELNWLKTKVAAWQKLRPEFTDTIVKTDDYVVMQRKMDAFLTIYQLKKPVSLEQAAKDWGPMSLKALYQKAGIPGLSDPPMVYLGPSTSKGHYDPKKNRIWINPKKNKTNSEKMKTLYFEMGNAFQRKELEAINSSKGSPEEKAMMVIKREFKTSKRELSRIMGKHKAKAVEDLVVKIDIPKNIMNQFGKKRTFSKTKRVPMPKIGALKVPDKRTALYWFQINHWSENNQIMEYALSPHTVGGKESTLELEIKKATKKK